jgi:cell wall-associated NlpC family hydrolase
MGRTRRESGQAAIVSVAVMLVLVLAGVAGGALVRASLLHQRVVGMADGAALVAAAVLREHEDDLLPRIDADTQRMLPPLLTRAALIARARTAAERTVQSEGGELEAFRVRASPRGLPLQAEVTARISAVIPVWVGPSALRSDRSATSRAGLDYPVQAPDPVHFRPVDLGGVGGIAAVIAAASAQLGWPYLWGGESRAEGGFDCSGLIDYALAAAGFPVGRPTAAGLQQISVPVPLAEVQAGDLVFVGDPAHHVGLVVRPGLAIEAPHRGATVHYEPLADGGWSSAGRLPALAGAGSLGDEVPPWVPDRFRAPLVAASADTSLPVAFLAAQLEVESGFDPDAVSGAGALGLAQFMPATWAGAWNPWRRRDPRDPDAAIRAQARYMRTLVDRAGGDLSRALAAYHDGWSGSAALPWPAATRAYVFSIMHRFGGGPWSYATSETSDMSAPLPGIPMLRLIPLGG